MVAVKQVAALEEDQLPVQVVQSLDLGDAALELNDWDRYALEAGVALAEEVDDASVVAVTVGPAEADDVLVESLAKGAERAIRVHVDTPLDDPFAVATRLTAVAKREQIDLILFGVQAADVGHAATGVATAAAAGMRSCAVVRTVVWDGAALEMERELEGGLLERVRLHLPAVVTIQTGSNRPRYANLRAIKQARSKPIEVLSESELEVADLTRRAASVRGLRRRSRANLATMLEGEVAVSAERVADLIRTMGAA